MTVTGDWYHIGLLGRQTLGEVRHHLVDVFLWQLFQDGPVVKV